MPQARGNALGNSVPVIDIAGLVANPSSARAISAIDAIARACEEWGFFQITGHGIPAQRIDRVWDQVRGFFARAECEKQNILRTRDNPWGYYNNELTKNQRDRKEVFDFTIDGIDPIYNARNRWPANQTGFRETMNQHLSDSVGVSLILLRGFCIGLGLPADHMQADFRENHTGFVRLNYYPVKDPLDGSQTPHLETADKGVHHHTDAGALTLLLQDDVGGLQVYRDGYWHNVDPVPGAIVVNTGDMMQVWSNDRYRAAIHRVLAMEHRDRYSIPFFFNPSPDTVAEPLPTTVSETRPPRYRPITWSTFRGARTDGDYADYGTEIQIAQFRT